jgi:hypothetical protein
MDVLLDFDLLMKLVKMDMKSLKAVCVSILSVVVKGRIKCHFFFSFKFTAVNHLCGICSQPL